jgi:cytoskeleton protein RodZ
MSELGSTLIRAREARGLSLEDAERDTRISRRYLQALESEQFEVIPAPVYARGFLRSYSQYLGLDPQDMLLLFPRDEEAGYGQAASPSARPSMQQPASAVGPARPTWQRPPQTRVAKGTTIETPFEPTIGIDIGVPSPSRRLKTDPAAQARSLTVLIIAIGAVVVVVLLAYLISNLGSGGDSSSTPKSTSGTLFPAGSQTLAPGAGASASAAVGASGLPVKRGTVPDVLGQPLATAKLALQEAGFQVNERHLNNSKPKGTIIDQSPAPNIAQAPDSTVNIVVSDGP